MAIEGLNPNKRYATVVYLYRACKKNIPFSLRTDSFRDIM